MKIVQSILSVGFVVLAAAKSISAPTDQNWESRFTFAPGLNGSVQALCAMGTNLYAGGTFTRAGEIQTGGLARWDGSNWSAVGGVIKGNVYALATDGTNLYAGGGFTSAGGVSATNIARWNGTNWSSLGALYLPDAPNAFQAAVFALALDKTNLYAAGSFYSAGGTLATNVAKWNGQSWSALGDGLGTAGDYYYLVVSSLELSGTNLYAAGRFPISGSTPITNLARWDGTAWQTVGGGLGGGLSENNWSEGTFLGSVNALCATDKGLLVAGDFRKAGGLSITNLARWNGTNWSAVGVQTNGYVGAIVADGTNQIFLGSFPSISGVASAGVIGLRGNNWTAYGQGVFPEGIAAARVGTNLYVGGNFQIAGGKTAGFIARWDGVNWQPLSPGKSSAPLDFISDLAVRPDGQLVACGAFQSIGAVAANGIAKYDGTNWAAFGSGLSGGSGFPSRIAHVGTNLYAAGNFSLNSSVICLARWNGLNWVSLGTGVNQSGYAPTITDIVGGLTRLYVAGYFNAAGPIATTNLACWNGSQWSSVGYLPPIDPYCYASLPAISTIGDDLLICEKTHCYNPETTDVATVRRWNGNSWADLASPIAFANPGEDYIGVNKIVMVGTNLIVGGHFVVTNGVYATNLIRWDGNSWAAMNHPFDASSTILDLASDGTNLYAAAGVSSPFHVTAAKWNGLQWSPLGSGVAGAGSSTYISSLAVRGRDLYVAGNFNEAGGKPADGLALWHDFPDVTLAARGWQSNGQFGLRIKGGKNQSLRLQASTNLQQWSDLGGVTPTNDAFDLETGSSPAVPRRYYRLMLVP